MAESVSNLFPKKGEIKILVEVPNSMNRIEDSEYEPHTQDKVCPRCGGDVSVVHDHAHGLPRAIMKDTKRLECQCGYREFI